MASKKGQAPPAASGQGKRIAPDEAPLHHKFWFILGPNEVGDTSNITCQQPTGVYTIAIN